MVVLKLSIDVYLPLSFAQSVIKQEQEVEFLGRDGL